ncbi:hypothetical protein GZH53_06360 [Flavihumibacter sp. R14]|nr:hypothetical protein [Flavihumibacter soli]
MKTKILKMMGITVMAFVVIIISSSRRSRAADKKAVVTELKDVRNIHKISVIGNVELVLTQGTEENLKVYDNYYSKNALVQWENGELRISSFEDKKLTVHVTVSNLSSLEASGSSTINTTNELSAVDLDIQLQDNAKATIEAQAINVSSSIADEAKLELTGESVNQHLELSNAAEYHAVRFETQNRSMLITNNALASISQEGPSTRIKTISKVLKTEDSLGLDLLQ